MHILRSDRFVQCLVMLVAGLYLYSLSDRGWIPHDEGLLAQSAERVVAGELPHVDFDDTYTGGQSWVHAVAFRVLGVKLYSMRLVLLAFSVAFVAVFYCLASRLVSTWGAVALTALAVVWSTPNYFAALPSWYNLYFATFGVWTLVRFDETGRHRWIFFTGLLGGLSFLFKLSGLYFIAAAILYLVYHEQESAMRSGSDGKRGWILGFTTICLGTFVLALASVVRNRLTPMDTLHFVWPGAVLSGALVVNEYRLGASDSWSRFLTLVRRNSLLLLGAALPVGLFLVPFWLAGGLERWWEGVFVLPQKRIQWTDYSLPPLGTLVGLVPFVLLLAIPLFVRRRWDHVGLVALFGTVFAIMVLVGNQEAIYGRLWSTTRPLVPLVVTVGCVMLVLRRDEILGRQRSYLFLTLATAAMVSLVQFPYSYSIYFCYVAPLVILAYAAVVSSQEYAPRRLQWSVLGLYLGFALVWLNHGHVRAIGVRYVPANQSERIEDIERFGLRTSPSQARLYRDVIREIQKHSKEGSAIYATSDCPEIYFLANRRNPTRTFYDFFDSDFEADPQNRYRRIVAMLKDQEIDVVVFNWEGEFSGSPTTEFAEQVVPLFPNVRHFVRDPNNQPNAAPTFSVAWRER